MTTLTDTTKKRKLQEQKTVIVPKIIEKLTDPNFFGTISIKVQGGIICDVAPAFNLKPNDIIKNGKLF
jgi:hypothetical protein